MSNSDHQLEQPDPTAQHDSPGQLLRAARIQRKQSLQEIAKRLFISEQRVEALEQDDYNHFSGRTYVRGYLVNYARLLGLDSHPLLEAFNQIAPQSVVPVDRYKTDGEVLAQQSKPRQFKLSLIITLLIALAVIAFYLVKDSAPLSSTSPSTLILDHQTKPLAQPLVGPALRTPESNQAKRPSQLQPISTVAIATEATGGPAPVATSPQAARLTITFRDQCWTDIRDTQGNKLHYDLQPANSKITLTITPPVKVFLGNASGTKIFYNDQPYQFPSRGRIANFTIEQAPTNVSNHDATMTAE